MLSNSLFWLKNLPQLSQVVVVFGAILVCAFLLYFLPQSWRTWHRLGTAKKRLIDDKAAPPEKALAGLGIISELAKEYQDTLHRQRTTNSNGQDNVSKWRASLPAEAFIRTDTIVDTQLRTEFFKHLPGILTGLGIIGTFVGLLNGLEGFQISDNPQIVRERLQVLLSGVREAFTVSALAISAAIIITIIEKLVISLLYAKVEALAQILDSRYQSGAGEEYLERLVKAAESSSAQMATLKQALVGDLKDILTTLSERQIKSFSESNGQLGRAIEKGFTDIAKPLGDIRQDQGQAVGAMLTDVMSAFSEQIKGLFGDQISGINAMQEKTIESLNAAVAGLQTMVGNIGRVGESGVEKMAEQLSRALANAEASQTQMNTQMTAFAAQIREAISTTQSESHKQLADQLAMMQENFAGMMRANQQATLGAAAGIGAVAATMSTDVGEAMTAVTTSLHDTSSKLQTAADAMRSVTLESVSKMNTGAETINLAANKFSAAGNSVSGVFEKSAAVTNALTQASGTVTAATTALSKIVTDYAQSRDAIGNMVNVLKELIETAKREATVNSDVVSRIEQAAKQLGAAQQQAGAYLGKVTDVIEESQKAFNTALLNTVGQTNTRVVKDLSDSANLLRGVVDSLSVAAGEVAPRKR